MGVLRGSYPLSEGVQGERRSLRHHFKQKGNQTEQTLDPAGILILFFRVAQAAQLGVLRGFNPLSEGVQGERRSPWRHLFRNNLSSRAPVARRWAS